MKTRDELLKAALEAGPERIEAALAAIRGEVAGRSEAAAGTGLLDVPAACRHMGNLSRVSLWRLRKKGLRSVKVGGRRMFRCADLDAAIEAMVEG